MATTPDPALLHHLVPLGTLGAARLGELAALARLETLPAGTALFRAGDNDHHAVYLIDGAVRLEETGLAPQTVRGAARLGVPTFALADHQPRRATAIADTAVEVLRLDNLLLDLMLAWEPAAGDEQRGPRAPLTGLHASKAFRNLPFANLEQLQSRLTRITARAGEVIVREGEPGDYYYVIECGRAEITRRGAGPQAIAELGPGRSFGEEALLADTRRNATVRLLTDGVLHRLARADFNALLRDPLLHWLNHDEASRRVNDGARWLDVRDTLEYRHVHVPGALSCPLGTLRDRTATLDTAIDYICYCRTGRQSAVAAFLLRQRGFRAHALRGGFTALPAGAGG
jgi:CRP-like cAMP-binding protein